MQDWRKDLPCNIQLVISYEIRMVALERIENERFVSLGNMRVCESPFIREVHLNGHCARVEARCFCVELQIDGLGGLNTDDELIAGDILEDT